MLTTLYMLTTKAVGVLVWGYVLLDVMYVDNRT